jgi:tetratricopeptide (TPR) repeat protein
MNKKIGKSSILFAVCLILSIWSIADAQQKPPCVAEAENVLIEAENTESYKKLSGTEADECVRKNPKSVEALLIRSRILAVTENFEAALADANRAIELAPSSSAAFYTRGFAYNKKYRKGYDKQIKPLALADYDKALALNAKNGSALLDKIEMKKNDGGSTLPLIPDCLLAIENLKANGDTAELARAHYMLGSVHSGALMHAPAVLEFTNSLKLRPNYIPALASRAFVKWFNPNNPDLDGAIADYSTILKIKPDVYYYKERASVYTRKGETAKAIGDYRAALAIDPDDRFAKEKLAALAPGASITAPAQSVQAAPKQKTVEQLAAEGRQQLAAKDYRGAIDSFSQCLVLKSDAAACYAFRGYALGMTNDLPSAKKNFDEAVKLAPNQPATYFIRGSMYTELGKKAEAIDDFRAVLKIDPNNTQAKAALQKLGVQP